MEQRLINLKKFDEEASINMVIVPNKYIMGEFPIFRKIIKIFLFYECVW